MANNESENNRLNENTVSQNNVVLIDPNNVVSNSAFDDLGIPKYEDMFIYVNLKAHKRNRSVLTINGAGNTVDFETTDEVNINLMGANQEDSPYNNTFTTNYYEGSANEDLIYDSFGIESINIKINSSYIPQINIKFVDVRGISFFNQEDSPYRIIFDFPPPIFELAVKGYYGKSLTYKMHLVKYTTEFKSNNGNFEIDAQFVALTYAPLTDVLFKYIVNFPLIEESNLSPDPYERPRNTNELIEKLRFLYSDGLKKIDNSNDVKALDAAKKAVNDISSDETILTAFKRNDILSNHKPFLIIRDKTDDTYFTVSGFDQYNKYISTTSDNEINSFQTHEIYISSYVGIGLNDNTTFDLNINQSNEGSGALKAFNKYRDNVLIGNISNNIDNVRGIVGRPKAINIQYDFSSNNQETSLYHKYIIIDVTKLYLEIRKKKLSEVVRKNEIISRLNTEINSTVQEYLGMRPTIYNIFKILLDDVDKFFELIRRTSEKAEDEHHNEPSIKEVILGGGGSNTNFRDYYDDKIYAFPLIIERKQL
ncbi:MAG: hypothetical protein ACOC2W_03435, partial [bacterium]